MNLLTEQSSQWIRGATEVSSTEIIHETFPDDCVMSTKYTLTKHWAVQNTGTQAWPMTVV